MGPRLRAKIADIRCSQNGCRCEAIVPTQDGGGEFRFRLNEEGKKSVRQVFEVAKHDEWTLPAERHATGCSVDQHENRVDTEHDSETMPREWQMSKTVKNVGGNCADGDLRAEEGQLAVFHDASHQRIAFGSDVQTNPYQRKLSVNQIQDEQ